jgi:hypothetical protein
MGTLGATDEEGCSSSIKAQEYRLHTSQQLESCRVELVDGGVDVDWGSTLLAVQAVTVPVVGHDVIAFYCSSCRDDSWDVVMFVREACGPERLFV